MTACVYSLAPDSLHIDPRRRLSWPSAEEERGRSLDSRFPGMPLVVVDSQRRVIWGECRLEYLLQQQVDCVPVLEVDLPPLECLFLGFNLLQMVFTANLYEKLYFAALALEQARPEEIRRRTGLDIPLNPSLIAQLPVLLSGDFTFLLREGRLALPAARELAALPAEARRPLVELITDVHFTASQGLKLISMTREIMARDGCGMVEVLTRAGIDSACRTQRPAEAVLERLEAERFPMVAAEEKAWRRQVERLQLPPHIRVRHAPFFEPPGVEVNLHLADLDELHRLLLRLGRDGKDPGGRGDG